MSKNKSIIEKIASGKGFYITAALSFVVIVVAIAFVYNSSMNMLRDLDIPTTVKEAEKNQTGVSDPRVRDEDSDDGESAHAKETTRVKETRQGTTKVTETTAVTTTEEPTEPVEVFSNDVYVYPISGDVDRAFSLSPVYDETMEDWRVHKGVDFSAQTGSDVASIGNGKVTKVVYDTAWGCCIEVDYGDFTARYCGLEQGTTVIIDDVVSKGDIIGKTAVSPCESKQQAHFHFEIVKDGEHIDPVTVLSAN